MLASKNCGGEYFIADMRERTAKASVMIQTEHGQTREGGRERREPETDWPGPNKETRRPRHQEDDRAKMAELYREEQRMLEQKPSPGPDVALGRGYASQVVAIALTMLRGCEQCLL